MLWSPSSTRSSRARSGRSPRLGRPVDDDQVLVGHIAEQDPDDAEGKVKPCGDLGDRQDLVAEGGDGPLLRGQLRGLLPGGGRGDQRLDLQVVVSGRVRPPLIAYGRTRRGCGRSAGLVMAVPHVAGRSCLPSPPAAGFLLVLDDDDP
jgi:hypothetical protein